MLVYVSGNMASIEKKGEGAYVVVKEGNEEVLKIDVEYVTYIPSLEADSSCMGSVIGKLVTVPSIKRIIFVGKRNYSYGYDDTQKLIEIANLYNYLVKQKRIFGVSMEDFNIFSSFYNDLRYILFNLLRTDPLGAYVELKRMLREEQIHKDKETNSILLKYRGAHITLLNNLIGLSSKTRLIKIAEPYLDGYELGKRDVYKKLFRSTITPNFMFTQLMAQQPLNGEELDSYGIKGETDVAIFDIPGDVKYLYHLTPPEFKLNESEYELLELARTVLTKHEPKAEEFLEPDKMRQTFFNIGGDLIQELAEQKNLKLNYSDIRKLSKILLRYTVGFGLIEVLLQDKKIQDISVNGPIGQTPIYIVHQDYDDCVTNIIPSSEDAQSWASKFRMLSGRPLDEANPVLDTELSLSGARARVAIMTNPLSPWGYAYSFRRHRDKPWTLPLFINNNMISPLGAGLISFLIDGARTMIVAGTRSSGKTSFLGSMMVEVMRRYRLITLEDTLELPTEYLRKMGYNIQSMKVRSAISKGSSEFPADEGIRTSLRFGDSSLIVGEVRSLEAKALFEAMRIGALANVVAGTIHGDSPYGVFDRIVNDLEVPRTSFKAADIIVITNPVRSADGLHRWRRVIQITEVRKHWEQDPLIEKAFVDLMKYNPKKDVLEPTDDLMNGDSDILKNIAGNVKAWVGDWDAVWDNVILRTKIKETLVDRAKKANMMDLLEAKFVVRSNDMFHKISDSVNEDLGYLDSKRIFFEWDDWLKKVIRKRSMR